VKEYEVRWNSGTLYYPTRIQAMDFAKTNFFESCVVKEMPEGKVLYEVKNWNVVFPKN